MAQAGWKPAVRVQWQSQPDCETDKSSRDESRVIVIGGPSWKGHRSTDKRYAGDNRLITPELISTGLFGTAMSAHHILGLEQVPRVWLFAN